MRRKTEIKWAQKQLASARRDYQVALDQSMRRPGNAWQLIDEGQKAYHLGRQAAFEQLLERLERP